MRHTRRRMREAPLSGLPELPAQGGLVKWLTRTATALVIALAVGAAAPIMGQDPAPAREKPKKKTLEDAIARALRVSSKKIDNQKLVRATVLNGMHEDDETYLVICEVRDRRRGDLRGWHRTRI